MATVATRNPVSKRLGPRSDSDSVAEPFERNYRYFTQIFVGLLFRSCLSMKCSTQTQNIHIYNCLVHAVVDFGYVSFDNVCIQQVQPKYQELIDLFKLVKIKSFAHFLFMKIRSTFTSFFSFKAIRDKFKIFKLVFFSLVNHDEGRGQLCPDDIDRLSDWIFKVGDRLNSIENLKEKFLHPEGELEHLMLAERFQSKFPDLFPELYVPGDFKFRATKTERSVKSQFFFATGMFDRKGD